MSRPLRLLAYDVYTAHRRRWIAEAQAGGVKGLGVVWYVVLGIVITACLLIWGMP